MADKMCAASHIKQKARFGQTFPTSQSRSDDWLVAMSQRMEPDVDISKCLSLGEDINPLIVILPVCRFLMLDCGAMKAAPLI